jgi:hypothetical protein
VIHLFLFSKAACVQAEFASSCRMECDCLIFGRTLSTLSNWSHPLGQSTERSAVDATIGVINGRSEPTARLFTAEAAGSPEGARQIADLDQMMSMEPLSEVTTPRLTVRSIQFVDPTVARVEAENIQYGSVIMQRVTPVVFVMRKMGANWRVVSFRLPVDSAMAVPAARGN